jgi:hypothetical protein
MQVSVWCMQENGEGEVDCKFLFGACRRMVKDARQHMSGGGDPAADLDVDDAEDYEEILSDQALYHVMNGTA